MGYNVHKNNPVERMEPMKRVFVCKPINAQRQNQCPKGGTEDEEIQPFQILITMMTVKRLHSIQSNPVLGKRPRLTTSANRQRPTRRQERNGWNYGKQKKIMMNVQYGMKNEIKMKMERSDIQKLRKMS